MGKARTTVLLDRELVARAKAVSGARTTTGVLEKGLRELVRRASLSRLARILESTSDPAIEAAPRRRPK